MTIARFRQPKSLWPAILRTLVDQWPRPEPSDFCEYIGVPSDRTINHFYAWLDGSPEWQAYQTAPLQQTGHKVGMSQLACWVWPDEDVLRLNGLWLYYMRGRPWPATPKDKTDGNYKSKT